MRNIELQSTLLMLQAITRDRRREGQTSDRGVVPASSSSPTALMDEAESGAELVSVLEEAGLVRAPKRAVEARRRR